MIEKDRFELVVAVFYVIDIFFSFIEPPLQLIVFTVGFAELFKGSFMDLLLAVDFLLGLSISWVKRSYLWRCRSF